MGGRMIGTKFLVGFGVLIWLLITILDYYILGKQTAKHTKLTKWELLVFYGGRNVAEIICFTCGYLLGVSL